jgi:hypothetical protein
VEPDPDDLAFPGRNRAALWSDSSSDGERPEVEAPVPVERDTEEVAAKGAGAARWWKLPLDALRVWALRVATSAWSVPFAIALLGFAVLGRRLYRMRRQTKAVARVRLLLDEKVTPFLFFFCEFCLLETQFQLYKLIPKLSHDQQMRVCTCPSVARCRFLAVSIKISHSR